MTAKAPVRIFPLGNAALTVEFGDAISPDINERAIALSEHFESSHFPGFIESVPAFASTTIYYDPLIVRKHFGDYPTAFDAVSAVAKQILSELRSAERKPRKIEIAVDFSPSAALDLRELAAAKGLTPDAVIEIFTSREYRVYMLGFLPGFTYMGEVDARIASPRKQSPRTEVPCGSIGIAGSQTGIYSLASPGGWQIIGRTGVQMFTPYADSPTMLRPGDLVTFRSIR